MNLRIQYSKRAKKFLSKNSIVTKENVEELLITSAKVLLNKENLNIDLKKMKGSDQNLYRVRKGKFRILFSIKKNDIVILTVGDIGFRGDIY